MHRRCFNLRLLFAPLAAWLGGRRIAQAEEPIKSLKVELEAIRKRHRLPALGTAVLVDGETAAVEAVGVRRLGNPTPVTPGDCFHLGSCTKSMTATLLALLVDDGKLRWESSVAELFPDLGVAVHPDLRPATLEQLLCHRAGLTGESWPDGKDFEDIHRLSGSPLEQRREYARLFLKQKPPRRPGADYEYANAGFALAAAAAERITGVAWEELMRTRLFAPLGITTGGFGAMGSAAKLDQPRQHASRLLRWVPVEPGPLSDNPPAIGPGGTVHMCLADWAKYAAAHLRGARAAPTTEKRLLRPETWRRLHTPLPPGDYAFGWGTAEREWGGGTVLTHTGSNTMNFAVVWMAPLKNFAVMVVTNQGGRAAEQACDEVAAAMIERHLR